MKRMLWVCLLVFGLMLSWSIVIAGDFYVIPVKKSGTYDPPCFDNTNRYVDCGNGTVYDTVTNLIWLKKANCFLDKSYAAANNAAAGLGDGDCGLTDGSSPGDWRLPTMAEWQWTFQRAVALGCINPAFTNTAGTSCGGPDPFTYIQVGERYWSSTAVEANPTHAWSVEINSGALKTDLVKTASGNIHAWPIRSGNY